MVREGVDPAAIDRYHRSCAPQASLLRFCIIVITHGVRSVHIPHAVLSYGDMCDMVHGCVWTGLAHGDEEEDGATRGLVVQD